MAEQQSKKELVVGGLYEHFKGGRYKVLFEAKDSETTEPVVVYLHLDDGSIWVRPKKMFLEDVDRDGVVKPRFKLIDQTVK